MTANRYSPVIPSLKRSLWSAGLFVVLLWCVKSAEILFDIPTTLFGVKPGEIVGLLGVLTAPLIHGSYEHLLGNSMALFLLLSALHYGYPKTKYWVIAVVWLISGLGTWLFARESVHIGASGITHGLFFYILTISILRRDKRSILLMMIAFFMYGGMVMTIFPREEHISFEYHFFGAIAGFVCALLFRNIEPKPYEKLYVWERHPELEDDIIGDQWQLGEHDSQAHPVERQGGRHTSTLYEQEQANNDTHPRIH